MSGLVNVTGAVSGVIGTSVGTPAGGVESDTVMVFHQSAAPTGWTKLTATGTGDDGVNDVCLRCITGNITDGVGGTVAMTTALASQAVASHVVASNEMPAHTHNGKFVCGGFTCSHVNYSPWGMYPGASPWPGGGTLYCTSCPTSSTGAGGGHTHTAIDLAVKYVDVIVASKD